MVDWNPDAYARFADLRLRPARDLLAQVGDLPVGALVDLGCGNGVMGADLAAHYAGRAVIGVDSSPAMLAQAGASGGYSDVQAADIATWQPDTPPALIFSNAVLHWLPDHAVLMARLAGMLVNGGVLAVQMPRQFNAPSHRFLRDIAANMFPDRFDFFDYEPPVRSAVAYWQMLAPLGMVEAWESDYVQRLAPDPQAHPVRRFTETTAMRPFLAKLDASEAASFIHAYEAALTAAYPLMADGAALFPFRRVFFTLKV